MSRKYTVNKAIPKRPKKSSPHRARQWQETMMPTYGAPSLTLIKGKGAVLFDESGKKYVDFLGGIATSVVGHAHPRVVSAIRSQAGTLSHISNLYMHPRALELAEKLIELSGDESARVFFCNSGAEANEAALKLSRKTGRRRIVATHEAFHGRTMGALSLTGQPSKRDPFKPLLPGIKHIPFGDIRSLEKSVSRKTAMVILEPIQGEAGVLVPPAGYLKRVREICDHYGALMVLDCVQTGMGRTGRWFGYEDEEIQPDAITLAKGLGGGLPLGALVTFGIASKLFQPGDHGSTFGGNPVTTAAGLAAIDVIEEENLMAKVRQHEKYIKKTLAPHVKEVRGRGLLLGIELHGGYSKELAISLQEQGILVNAPRPSTIRIAPPLNIASAEIKNFCSTFISIHKEFSDVSK